MMRRGRSRVAMAAAVSLQLLLPLQASATEAGGLDLAFGGGSGTATLALPAGAGAWATALQPDGKIVLAGFSGPDLALARLLSDGTPDTDFGTGGIVTLSATSGGGDEARVVVVQPDGKIVVAGDADLDHYLVARFDTAGVLDPTFGIGGVVTTDLTPGVDVARDMALQPDGKIVLAGNSGSGRSKFSLARYLDDGTLDMTFGDHGVVIVPFGVWGIINSIAILPSGRIVAGGSDGAGFALARFLPDGSLDQRFGDGGKVPGIVGVPSMIGDIAIDGDRRIVAVGDRDFFATQAARYLPRGALDTSFADDGFAHYRFGSGEQGFRAVALQPDGRILAAGYVGPHEVGDPAVARFVAERLRPNGSLDASFNETGKSKVSFPGGAFGADATLQPDGGFVIVGSADLAGVSIFAAARLLT